MPEPGRIQVYMGAGKGKTTASVGLAVRCAGAGGRVAFLQFDKGGETDPRGESLYNERKALAVLPGIELFPFGQARVQPDGQFRFANIPEDHQDAARALDKACELVADEQHDLIVLDEILVCYKTGLVKTPDILELIRFKREQHPAGELVLTGRYAPEAVLEQADLVTEMCERRHYFHDGAPARRGIDY